MMLVGEQPGDVEDRGGRPFIGPAGSILDQALAAIGIERRSLYLTNAVKHFKWEPRGKSRLHKNPSAREVAACRPWLIAETAAVRPHVVVCLGATATRSLLGPSVRVTRDRGAVLGELFDRPVVVTVHPASIVLLRDHEERRLALEGFVADLRIAWEFGLGAGGS
jgi:uracil-DNA glycosylase